MRFPLGARRLAAELGAVLPQNRTEWLFRLGPEALFAVTGAAMAPEGTPLTDRGALAAEDLLIGLGSSLLGSGAGRLAGKAIFPKALGADMREQKLAQAMTAGDILAAPLPMFAPRPVASSVYEKALQGQSRREQEEALQEEEQRHMQEALAMSMLTGGGTLLLPPGGSSMLT